VLKSRIREFAKKIAFRYTSLAAPDYPYNLEPIQLATLISELERLRAVDGTILEIGVARGMTTRFLCEHIATSKLDERLAVIDTFASFLPGHLEHEVSHRGKTREDLELFAYNDFEVWKRNFRQFPFLTAFCADCSTFNYSDLAPIKLALLDVDLYLPTRAALEEIYRNLSDSGVILVDDVADNNVWDGAFQAYNEFCSEHGIAPELIGKKGGIIRKRNNSASN
jgi:Macrocin-O-methyltransferase (TylF)